jgi:alpha-tubulin N-acetyltransferase 1
MELEIKVEEMLKVDQDGFICLSGRDYLSQTRPQMKEKGLALLSRIITTLGERSAAAQKLKQVITTPPKFYGSDQRLYLKVSANKALGFVKVGERKLFYHDHVVN